MPRLLALALLVPFLAGEVAGAALPEPERAVALPVWEGLTDRFQGDLAGFAAALRKRDFAAARTWFAPSFHGEPCCGGAPVPPGKSAVLPPWVARSEWKHVPLAKGQLVDARGSLAPLEQLLASWRAVEHLELAVPQALFYDRDGTTGAARVVLSAGGRDAQDRPVALAVSWDLCVRRDGEKFLFECLTMRGETLTVAGRTVFRDATAALGPRAVVPQASPEPDGALGIAAGDVDGDGFADLLIPGAGGLLLARGDGFAPAGVAVPAGSACLIADLDGDGWPDLLVGSPGRDEIALYENMGDGTFRARGGLAAGAGVQGLAAADLDGDGRLDVFACRAPTSPAVPDSWIDARNGLAARLFLQVGRFAFRECAAERGIRGEGWGRACAAADADGDGDVDLFVANDHGRDFYFENDGSGHFTERAADVGLADPGKGGAADWGDWDGDGQLDLHVGGVASGAADRMLGRLFGTRPADGAGARVQALADGNALYLRRRAHFDDARKRSGTAGAGWCRGGGFLDFDNDGRLDLFDAAGAPGDADGAYWRHVVAATLPVPAQIDQGGPSPVAGGQRDRLFWNAGLSRGVDVSALCGADDPGDGRGVAFLDLDHDGDTDILVRDADGVRAFRNEIGADAGWLRLELAGTESNRDAIGARVRVHAGKRAITRTLSSCRNDRALLVGMGADAQADAVDVWWPSGVIEHYGPWAARSSHRITEGSGELGTTKWRRPMTGSPRR